MLNFIMRAFKFNFFGPEKEEKDKEKTVEKKLDKIEDIEWFPCKKIDVEEERKVIQNMNRCKMFHYKDVDIGYVIYEEKVIIKGDLKINPLDVAENKQSDLITGKYEGGLKVWECTEDLMKYLVDNKKTIKMRNKKVLDLGCGVGMLGLYAFTHGSFVTFQDYNKETITCVTLPSVLLNLQDLEEEDEDLDPEEKIKRCQFYSGDWASFNNVLPDKESYDFILTSETIYNESNYDKLIDIFTTRLSENGCAYLAAKTCYFGVGGGLRQFEKLIKKTELLTSEVVWENKNGIQREIIKISRL